VKEIIVPRVEMTSFDLREGRSAFLEQFVRTRRNKIPVHEGNVDAIKGYLNAKDVLSFPDRPLAELIRMASLLEHVSVGGCRERRTPRTDAAEGLRVLRVLEAAQKSLEADGEAHLHDHDRRRPSMRPRHSRRGRDDRDRGGGARQRASMRPRHSRRGSGLQACI
jgi:hypothetical protein